jgi:ribosomal protein S18 acetylase RimI-like enzyme
VTLLQADDFLAGILGRPSFRVALPEEELDDAAVAAIREAQRRPVFLFARVSTLAVAMLRSLEALGFGVVDTNVTLERPAAPVRASTSATLRFAAAADREGVMRLAGTSFAFSRLHLDPAVTREAADRSRAEWAGNFFAGRRGDHMVVAEAEGGVAGFLQLLGPADGLLTIDLIAVAPPFRKRGIAAGLIAFAVAELKGLRMLRVGTQAANVPSLRLYEKLGFRTASTHYLLHFHRI